jgi:imidazolonepropionase-like amidohydrolase
MGRLVLVGAALLDGTGGDPVRGQAVVVEDDRIAAVVPDTPVPPGPRVALDGLTLLPGLINCHVHLCLGGEAEPVTILRAEPYATTVIKEVLRARATVEAGVTTVRDLGGREYAEVAVRDAVARGLVPGPRILTAGRAICMTGGHGWQMGGREADGPDEVRRAVREQLRAGADVIKLIATGGVMTPGVEPGSAQLALEELRAGVEEAKKAGRRAAAHAQGSEGIEAAVAAGISTIEHGVFLTEPIAQQMARDGIALVATLVPPDAIVRGGVEAGIPEFAVRKSADLRERHVESVRLALRHGVTIAVGTDAGTPLNPHGSVLPELRLMAGAGMTPSAVVAAATSVAARALGVERDVGRIAPGLIADLIAVAGNPVERLEALDEVCMVMTRGRLVVNRLAGRR